MQTLWKRSSKEAAVFDARRSLGNLLWARHSGLVGVLCMLLVWVILSRLLGNTLVAKPWEVARALYDSLRGTVPSDQNIILHAAWTLKRSIAGWLISLFLGGVLGILLGSSSAIYRITEPVVEFARAIPPILAFPLLLVVFNYGEEAYIWSIIYGSVAIIILSVARGVQSISPERTDTLKVFKIQGSLKTFALFMEIFPSLVLGARLAFSVSLIVAVVTEMVFTPRNGLALGAMVKDAEMAFRTQIFYGAIIVIGTFGYLGNVAMRKLENYLS
jgi:ABC-type nitrate/sulfonate/bicarbonate transport system permease component